MDFFSVCSELCCWDVCDLSSRTSDFWQGSQLPFTHCKYTAVQALETSANPSCFFSTKKHLQDFPVSEAEPGYFGAAAAEELLPCAVRDHHLLGGSAQFCLSCCSLQPLLSAFLFSGLLHLYPHHTIPICLHSKQFFGTNKYPVYSWQHAAFLRPAVLCWL